MGTTHALHVELHDGFAGETVTASLDGEEVWHEPGVRTRLQIDLAATFTLDVAPGAHRFELGIPERRTALVLDLTLQGPLWLAVDLCQDGSFAVRQSTTPFRHA